MLIDIVLVAIGGALGAVARYMFSISPLKTITNHFPFPTFSVNIIGSFLIGLGMIYFTNRAGDNEAMKLALFAGFLGSFTTFSAFQFEIYELIKDGNHMTALLYAFGSVAVGLIGLFLGTIAGRAI